MGAPKLTVLPCQEPTVQQLVQPRFETPTKHDPTGIWVCTVK